MKKRGLETIPRRHHFFNISSQLILYLKMLFCGKQRDNHGSLIVFHKIV